MYFVLMLLVIGFISGVFTIRLAGRIGLILQLFGVFMMGGTLLMFALCALLNPGVASTPEVEQPLLPQPFCSTCQVYQACGTLHCPACGVCVRQRDHHCPWVGKCIGEGNVRSFNLFLLGLLGSTVYILVCGSMAK